MRLFGRLASAFFVVAGVCSLVAAWFPSDHPGQVAKIGAAMVGLGFAGWFTPWERWPPAVMRWTVPGLAFTVIGLSEILGLAQPASFGASFVLTFVWLGLSQPRGVPLRALVPAAVAYVGPLLATGAAVPDIAASAFVLPVAVLAGEVCAWLGECEERAEVRAQSTSVAVERLLEASTRQARATSETEAADIAATLTEELLSADLAVIMVRETPGSSRFVLATDRDLPFPKSEFVIDVALEPSAIGMAVASGEPSFEPDIQNSAIASARLGRHLDVNSAAFFPLPGEGGYLGALVAMWRKPRHAVERVTFHTAGVIASETGLALERTRATTRRNVEVDRLTAAQEALRRSEGRARQLIATAGQPFISIDEDGRVLEWNHQAEAQFGWQRDEVLGRSLAELIVPDHLRALHTAGLRRYAATGEGGLLGRSMRLEAVTRSGETMPVELTIWTSPVDGTVSFNAFVRDVSQQARFEAELSRQALHDPLTGLPNRALLADRLTHALSDERHPAPVTALFLDLDGFKTVNDSLGHTVGDHLLVHVAQRLQGLLRPADTVARIAGDEFAVLLEDTPVAGGMVVAERIHDTLEAPHEVDGHSLFVSASIGIAGADAGGCSADDLLRNADLAMYVAKRRGRGRGRGRGQHAVFEIGMHHAALSRLQLEADLRRALARSELFLQYQPIVRLGDGTVVGMEALVRWCRDGELVPPAVFVPIAEDSGLIAEVGRFVMTEACRQAQDWRDAADSGDGPAYLSVNVSGHQIQGPGFVDEVAGVLRATGFPPEKLVIELTESVLMEERHDAAALLKDLKRLGTLLAIDDFGTAYSSLARLQTFPIDILKVDRTFVTGLLGGPEEAALAHAIVKLGHTLDLKTVAEGIEDEAQRKTLHAIGCEFGQGYLFARPLSAAAMGEILRRNPQLQESGPRS